MAVRKLDEAYRRIGLVPRWPSHHVRIFNAQINACVAYVVTEGDRADTGQRQEHNGGGKRSVAAENAR
jgi:hypothetical protein